MTSAPAPIPPTIAGASDVSGTLAVGVAPVWGGSGFIYTAVATTTALTGEASARSAADDAITMAVATKLAIASNLADLASASTARANLGLGTAATQASGAFDASGAATTVQTNLTTHTSNTANPHATTAAQLGAYTTAAADTLLAAKAPLASPALTGTPTAPTATTGTATTQLATTAFVGATAAGYLPLAGGTVTGAVRAVSGDLGSGSPSANAVLTLQTTAGNGVGDPNRYTLCGLTPTGTASWWVSSDGSATFTAVQNRFGSFNLGTISGFAAMWRNGGSNTAGILISTGDRVLVGTATDDGVNKLQVAGAIISSVSLRTGRYTVATLPTPGTNGRVAYATNGRKSGESASAGTGVPCWDDGLAWRTYDGSSVAA